MKTRVINVNSVGGGISEGLKSLKNRLAGAICPAGFFIVRKGSFPRESA